MSNKSNNQGRAYEFICLLSLYEAIKQIRNAKIIKMLNAIGDLKLGDYKDNTIDTFGDAYEFLMTMYASKCR